MTTTDREREAPTMTIRRTPDTRDHVPAAPGFYDRACLAVAPGAVGDCVRLKDHTGDHQSADFWSWPNTMTPQEIDLGALSDAQGALHRMVDTINDYPPLVGHLFDAAVYAISALQALADEKEAALRRRVAWLQNSSDSAAEIVEGM